MSASKPAQPASAPEPLTGLKQLRTELGQVKDRLADARAREAAAALARFREEVALLGITEQEVRRALGYDRPARLPAKYYDPVTGSKWSGKGKRPRWPGRASHLHIHTGGALDGCGSFTLGEWAPRIVPRSGDRRRTSRADRGNARLRIYYPMRA